MNVYILSSKNSAKCLSEWKFFRGNKVEKHETDLNAQQAFTFSAILMVFKLIKQNRANETQFLLYPHIS